MRRVLIVDDEDYVRCVLSEFLKSRDFIVSEARNGLEALDIFSRDVPGAVLLDIRMPGMDGMEVLSKLMEKDPTVPVIMLSAHGDINAAVEAVKKGAYDFMSKPPDFEEIFLKLSRAIEKAQLSKELKRLSNSVEASFSKLFGKSQAIKRIIDQVNQVAPSPFSVIIQGETGTGKSTLAELIHNLSSRSDKSFVRVDIGVIPETIIESELFGHVKGAFTGADRAKKGYFEAADGGTVFLDELENMSLHVQAKLLSAVEQKSIFSVGSAKAVPVDFRIIAATNTDLAALVREKKFREDLFYRLNEFTIFLPPLSQRREDIAFLAQRFCDEACEELKKKSFEIDDDAMDLLLSYGWPGNIRELKNVTRRAVLFCKGSTLSRACLKEVMNMATEPQAARKAETPQAGHSLKEISSKAVSEAERVAIQQALALSQGNKSKAAFTLQVDYKTLLTKIKHYGL